MQVPLYYTLPFSQVVMYSAYVRDTSLNNIISHVLKWLSAKRQEKIRMWKKGNPCTLLVEMYTDVATMKNSMEILQNIQNRTTI